jgi:hypothetical protein
MENDSKNRKNTPKKDLITRRRMFQITAVGVLIAVPGLHIIYQRSRPRPFGVTNISIEGPFEKYGRFKPENLRIKAINETASDFQLLYVGFSQGTYEDHISLSFDFVGKEDPNRMMKVSISIYDNENKVIGGGERILGDPRISARNAKLSNMQYFEPIAALSVNLNEARNISHISHIEIVTMEIKTL